MPNPRTSLATLLSFPLSPDRLQSMEAKKDVPVLITRLESACSELKILIRTSSETDLFMDKNLERVPTNMLDTRINRAVSPALVLLDSFKLAESLLLKLIDLSSKLSNENSPQKRLKRLKKYVDCVNELNSALSFTSQDSEPAIQKLQEVIEFLNRTKGSDRNQIQWLRETLNTIKALYKNEDVMRFEGLVDEALLNLQDEYEGILLELRHRNIEDDDVVDDDMAEYVLGNELEVDVLREISETLAANDFLDTCIDIFVKVRYKRAAKALMRLNPEYLSTYTPEEIDEMEWENLETSITLWTQHFELAVRKVLVAEKNLSYEIMGNVMDNQIWRECFIKIADKIMAVFFRFGEGVARGNNEPHKLFMLLDMFESLENLNAEFAEVFEGEAGKDICLRYTELEKLLIHAASKAFSEFSLQIEANQDTYPPLLDGSIPLQIRYTINYLRNLSSDTYAISIAKVLKTGRVWQNGVLSKLETEENLLREAVVDVLEALQRSIEARKRRYIKDKVLSHVLSINTNWYVYMRTKNSKLGKLLGDQYMKKRYKLVAEESAYLYQKQAWGPLVEILAIEDDATKSIDKEASGALARGKIGAFMNGLNDMSLKHRSSYTIPDSDLREQIRESTISYVLPAYKEFVNTYALVLNSRSGYPTPAEVEGSVVQMFGTASAVRSNRKARGPGERHSEMVDRPREVRDYRRSKSSSVD